MHRRNRACLAMAAMELDHDFVISTLPTAITIREAKLFVVSDVLLILEMQPAVIVSSPSVASVTVQSSSS